MIICMLFSANYYITPKGRKCSIQQSNRRKNFGLHSARSGGNFGLHSARSGGNFGLHSARSGGNFGLHSARSGGATIVANKGVPDRLFKLHGRWVSDKAKDAYVKDTSYILL